MEFIESDIKGLIEIQPKLWGDARGVFFESYRKDLFENAGIPFDFVQDNQSFSEKGVVRGLHMQLGAKAQGKLVRVVMGKVLDVVVDVRIDSPTFGQHRSFVLDSQKNNLLFIPEGFLHGFSALEDSIFAYSCTNFYDKASEAGVIYNDPSLNIDWMQQNPNVSEKDMALPTLEQLSKVLNQA
jgi:dTDP-4-dehydrorhamnose 3,5-epimerase